MRAYGGLGQGFKNTISRVDVPALEWSRMPGTDFWLMPRNEGLLTGVTNEPLLADREWTTTALTFTASSGADFLDSTDVGTPEHYLTDASADLLQSPNIFGDYIHGQQAAYFLGYSPTKLIVEFYASMTVHTADEAVSGWGLVEAGGTAGTAASADHMAWINTDGSNFRLSSAADSDLGAADNANWNLFKIVVNTGSVTDAIEWFINGVSQGTIDRQADLWPCSFGMFASTTNRPALAWVHAWYS